MVKETVQATIQPYLDEQRRPKRKVQLIRLWAVPKIEDYIRDQGLEAYVNEESKRKIKEYVHNHFMKVLVGNE